MGISRYNIGLALLPLDKIYESNCLFFVANGQGDVFKVKPFIPDWWPKVNVDRGIDNIDNI